MLTDENIAKINEFIEDHATMTHQQMAAKYFGSNRSINGNRVKVAAALTSLRNLGINIPAKAGSVTGIPPHELAEFRAWKAQQQRIAAE